MNKESSDEKLLKLIEGNAEARHLPRVGIKLKGPALFLQPKFQMKFRFSLSGLNKMLFLAGLILTGVFIYRSVSAEKVINADLFMPAGTGKSGPAKTRVSGDRTLPLPEYLAVIDKRNIFLPSGSMRKVDDEEAAEKTAAQFEAVEKELKLVGIIWSDEPEAMIEDQTDKRTYLVKKGDTAGQKQCRIKEVRRSSVLLEVELGGQAKEWELR